MIGKTCSMASAACPPHWSSSMHLPLSRCPSLPFFLRWPPHPWQVFKSHMLSSDAQLCFSNTPLSLWILGFLLTNLLESLPWEPDTISACTTSNSNSQFSMLLPRHPQREMWVLTLLFIRNLVCFSSQHTLKPTRTTPQTGLPCPRSYKGLLS